MKEIREILAELVRKHPHLREDRDFTGLRRTHIADAMKTALPPERHRSDAAIKAEVLIPHFRELIRTLDHAGDKFLSITDARKPPIKWSDAEIDTMVERLVDSRPELLEAETLDNLLTIPDVRLAQEALDPSRRRVIATARQVAPLFLAGLQRLRDRLPPPPPEQEPEAEKRTLVRTTAAEWVLVAEKMHERNPFFGYPYKEHLAGLGEAEIRDAMREALPPHRRRKTVFPHQCREPLLEAFKTVRARLDAEQAEKERAAELEKARLEAEALAAIAKAETPPPVAAAPAAAPDTLGDAVRTVFRAFGEEFAKGAGLSLSGIEAMLINVLAAAAPAVAAAPVAAAPVAPPAPAAPEPELDQAPESKVDPLDLQPPVSYSGPEGVKARPPRIAVIGPQGTLSRELEHAFPEVDFSYIERGPKGVPEAVDGCDRIIAIANFFNEATKIAVKRTDKGKQKLIVVDGGVSKVKRAIHVFMSSRAEKPMHH